MAQLLASFVAVMKNPGLILSEDICLFHYLSTIKLIIKLTSINGRLIYIHVGAHSTDDQNSQLYAPCMRRERPSENCVTCIVFVI